MELTLLAVALLPVERLERLVEDVIRDAEEAVRKQVREMHLCGVSAHTVHT